MIPKVVRFLRKRGWTGKSLRRVGFQLWDYYPPNYAGDRPVFPAQSPKVIMVRLIDYTNGVKLWWAKGVNDENEKFEFRLSGQSYAHFVATFYELGLPESRVS
jgi:hypothetical protein